MSVLYIIVSIAAHLHQMIAFHNDGSNEMRVMLRLLEGDAIDVNTKDLDWAQLVLGTSLARVKLSNMSNKLAIAQESHVSAKAHMHRVIYGYLMSRWNRCMYCIMCLASISCDPIDPGY